MDGRTVRLSLRLRCLSARQQLIIRCTDEFLKRAELALSGLRADQQRARDSAAATLVPAGPAPRALLRRRAPAAEAAGVPLVRAP